MSATWSGVLEASREMRSERVAVLTGTARSTVAIR
jgi:hypothetical protein